mgnify:CR=1 FL=1
MYSSENYQIASKLFIQGLGLIYFIAFFPFIFQIKGLIGKKGILPVQSYLMFLKSRLGPKAYYKMPTLFWINSSDFTLLSVVYAGVFLSIILILGYYPIIILPLLYILYLSIIHGGQDFLSFGWEVFLMEITINAFFLAMTEIPNPFIWISINFLLFRFHFEAGIVKLLSNDPSWKNLTAMYFHYQTQPIANTTAWFAHKLPMWFHKASCLLMFIIELIIPFGIFGNEEMRLIVFFCFVGLQVSIWLTGNFSYLNYLTVIFSTILLSDHYLSSYFTTPASDSHPSIILNLSISSAGIFLFTFQLISFWNHLISIPLCEKFLNKLRPFFVVNRYGIFAVMTTKRYEIIIEGSNDGIEWKEYIFKHKASELNRRPRRISPYQPRLDWQAWFLPFRSYRHETWFQNFLVRLLQGEKSVTDLLRLNPFAKHPPKYIRAQIFDYTFTDKETKKSTGNWWKRVYVGAYSPTLCMKQEQIKE